MSRILIPPNLPAQNRIVTPDENGDVVIRPEGFSPSIDPPPDGPYEMNIVYNNAGHLQTDGTALWQSGISDQFIFSYWFSQQDNISNNNIWNWGVGTNLAGVRLEHYLQQNNPTHQRLGIGRDARGDIYDNFSDESADRDGPWHLLVARSGTTLQAWLNDAELTMPGAPTAVAVDFPTMNRLRLGRGWAVGAVNTYFGDFWWYGGQYLDLDVEANRRLFTEANGAPKDLGEFGEVPLGTSPDIYFNGPAQQWNDADNQGTMLGWSRVDGPFTDVETG